MFAGPSNTDSSPERTRARPSDSHSSSSYLSRSFLCEGKDKAPAVTPEPNAENPSTADAVAIVPALDAPTTPPAIDAIDIGRLSNTYSPTFSAAGPNPWVS